MKILTIVTNGFEEVELCGTIGILRRAGIDLTIASLNSNEATGRYGLKLADLKPLSSVDYKEYDMLFIPGGPEYVELENSSKFISIVDYFYKNDKRIAAICAGPTILGHLGFLKGKNYTCFKSMNEDFGGKFIDTYCVKDGKIITGKSAAASIDFAFMIMEEIIGKEKTELVKNSIYYYEK